MHGIQMDNHDIFRDRNDGVGAGLFDKFSVEGGKSSAKPAPTKNLAIIQNHDISCDRDR
jgi:hypothetical protein